jgi:hypothetical protein
MLPGFDLRITYREVNILLRIWRTNTTKGGVCR